MLFFPSHWNKPLVLAPVITDDAVLLLPLNPPFFASTPHCSPAGEFSWPLCSTGLLCWRALMAGCSKLSFSLLVLSYIENWTLEPEEKVLLTAWLLFFLLSEKLCDTDSYLSHLSSAAPASTSPHTNILFFFFFTAKDQILQFVDPASNQATSWTTKWIFCCQ